MATRSSRVTGGVSTTRPRSVTSGVRTGVSTVPKSVYRPLAPSVVTPPPVATTASAAPALPTDPTYEARLKYLDKRIAALPGEWNPRREALAATSARGITDTGYADTATWSPLTTDTTGNVTYGLNLGGEGQVQRNAISGNAGQFNSRGTYYSTARNRQDRLDTQQIQNARDAMLRRFQTDQTGLYDQQESARLGISGEQATTQDAYRDWRADQPVAPSAPLPETPGPGEAASASRRRVWTGASRPVDLERAGWKVSRRGNGSWVAIK